MLTAPTHLRRARFLLFVGHGLLLLIVFGFGVYAQRLQPVQPAVFRKARPTDARPTAPSRRARLPRPFERKLGALTDEELNRAPSRVGAETIGVHRELAGGGIAYDQGEHGRQMTAPGAWVERDGGTRVWRMAIQSDDAAGLRVHFSGFSVETGRVWIHSDVDGDDDAESFTAQGPFRDGDFWSPVIFSSSAVIEFEPDPSAPAEESVPFQIKRIAHLWRTPGEVRSRSIVQRRLLPASRKTARSTTEGIQSSTDFLSRIRAIGSSVTSSSSPRAEDSLTSVAAAPCQVDVSCFPEWEETSRSVAMIVLESGGGTVACSGTLLNTRDGSFTPYFLTAGHCVNGNIEARSVEAFWQFRSATCNGAQPDLDDLASTLGARQIVRYGNFDDFRGDFNLLLLEDVPDGVVFAGWDPNPISIGTSVTGIHHAAAEQQRIVFGQVVPDNYYGVSAAYLIIEELEGRTESGSSGSGIFTEPNVLTGVLSFGPALPRGATVCDIDPSYTGYGRFSSFYPQISAYLEGEEPPPDDTDEALVSGVPRTFSLPAVARASLFSEPTFIVNVPENAVSLTIDLGSVTPSTADVDLYVRYQQLPTVLRGAVVSDFSSLSPTSTERIVIDKSTSPALLPGVYYASLALLTRATSVTGTVVATLELDDPVVSQAVPSLGAVTHAATQTQGAIAPGQLVSIYGTNLGPDQALQPDFDGSGSLPTSAGGVSVLFDGVPAPLLFVRSDQINVQVPYELAGRSTVQVVVSREGLSSSGESVEVLPSAPGVFTLLDGTDRAVVFNQDDTLNSASNSAERGQIVVLYATGEGLTSPESITGTPASNALLLPTPQLPVRVQIGGADAEVVFAGVPLGYVGLLQVNARIPLDSATGSEVTLTLGIGESQSPPVKLSVR